MEEVEFSICFDENGAVVPTEWDDNEYIRDYLPKAKEILEWLKEAKKTGKKIEIIEDGSDVVWKKDENYLEVPDNLVLKVLGTSKEKLSIEEALKCFEWLCDAWQRFLENYDDLLYEDEDGLWYIWQRWIDVKFLDERPASENDKKKLKKVRKWLEELKEKGFGDFLDIHVDDGGWGFKIVLCFGDVTPPEPGPEQKTYKAIDWRNYELWINREFVKKALGEEKEELTFEEALKIVDYLSERC